MGAVYEAEHTGTGRRVAIKVILRAQLARHPELVQRFEREARAAGSIDTQHIAQVLDAGTDAATSTPYLVMELLKGEDMEGLLDRLGPLPPDLALRLVARRPSASSAPTRRASSTATSSPPTSSSPAARTGPSSSRSSTSASSRSRTTSPARATTA